MASNVFKQAEEVEKVERYAVMSLYSEAMERCVIVDKRTVPDGRGGVVTEYVDGAPIQAAFSFDTSTQARVAEQAGATARYVVTTAKNINLQYHTIVKRLKDGKIFRITSDGDDNYTPPSSSLNIRQVEAEEWTIPAQEYPNG